jgi:N-acyl-D-aspartate/D-glutamate deacylase
MPFDTIIRGGTIATAADTFARDIGIRDGKIVALGHDLGAAVDGGVLVGEKGYGTYLPRSKPPARPDVSQR